MSVPVKIFAEDLKHNEGLPSYAKIGDSGMDIRANERVTIPPKETMLIHTGIHVGIPEGYEIQVRPRSGLSLKTKLRVANSPGTVDQSYTGEVCVIAENTHGSQDFIVNIGDRIAQLVLQEVPKIEWVPVQDKTQLGDTARGSDGFGSTGSN